MMLKAKEDVKKFITENDVIIRYVKNKRGYVNGVLISIEKGKISYAVFNESEDGIYRAINSEQLPVWRELRDFIYKNYTKKDWIFHQTNRMNDYMKEMQEDLYWFEFDKYKGLKIALNRALANKYPKTIPYKIKHMYEKVKDISIRHFK